MMYSSLVFLFQLETCSPRIFGVLLKTGSTGLRSGRCWRQHLENHASALVGITLLSSDKGVVKLIEIPSSSENTSKSLTTMASGEQH